MCHDRIIVECRRTRPSTLYEVLRTRRVDGFLLKGRDPSGVFGESRVPGGLREILGWVKRI